MSVLCDRLLSEREGLFARTAGGTPRNQPSAFGICRSSKNAQGLSLELLFNIATVLEIEPYLLFNLKIEKLLGSAAYCGASSSCIMNINSLFSNGQTAAWAVSFRRFAGAGRPALRSGRSSTGSSVCRSARRSRPTASISLMRFSWFTRVALGS